MDKMIPKFVTNERALLIGKSLIIADLHIGIEHALAESGIRIPSQSWKMLERIKKLIKKTRAERLILLGDIKHEIKGISFQEYEELSRFVTDLSNTVKIDLVPGNHDGNIRKLCPANMGVREATGFALGKIYVSHGHAWPSKEVLDCDYLVISHNHPAVEIKDKFGSSFVEPVWIKSELDKRKLANSAFQHIKTVKRTLKLNILKVIIIPAFNHLVGGMRFNALENKLLGPIVKLIDIGKSDVYLLDGTYLGKIGNLKTTF